MEFEKYKHHGEDVYVRSDLKGRHKDFCLCYKCEKFHPGSAFNCFIAESFYKLCVRFHTVNPVWECPRFEEI